MANDWIRRLMEGLPGQFPAFTPDAAGGIDIQGIVPTSLPPSPFAGDADLGRMANDEARFHQADLDAQSAAADVKRRSDMLEAERQSMPPMAAASAPQATQPAGTPAPPIAPPQEVKPPPGMGPSVPMADAAGPSSYTYGGHPQAYANNIGNLIAGPTGWAGKGNPYANKAAGLSFETFSDPAQGVAATFKNLQYQYGKGATTFDAMARRWLGVPDGADANKHGNKWRDWSAAVASGAGFKPDDTIPINDPQAMARVMRSINRIEHGRETVPPEAYLAGVMGQTMPGSTTSPFMDTGDGGQTPPKPEVGSGSDDKPATGGRRDSIPGLPRVELSPEERNDYWARTLLKASAGFFTPGGRGMSAGIGGLVEGMEDMAKAQKGDWVHLGNGVMYERKTGQTRKVDGVKPANPLDDALKLARYQKLTGQDASAKVLKPPLQKAEDEDVATIGITRQTAADLKEAEKALESKVVPLGPASRAGGWVRDLTVGSSEGDRNRSQVTTLIETMRNNKLALQKGVQTEGDAVRALNEIVNTTGQYDEKQMLANIKRVREALERSGTRLEGGIQSRRKSQGIDPYDMSTIPQASPTVTFEYPKQAPAASAPGGGGIQRPAAMDDPRYK